MAHNSKKDISYVRLLVYDLTLTELQFILDSVKQNKHGNKKALCKHIIHLLTTSYSKTKDLRQKILEVYKSRNKKQPAPNFNQSRKFRRNLLSYQQTMKIPKPAHFLEHQPSAYNQPPTTATFNNSIQPSLTDQFENFQQQSAPNFNQTKKFRRNLLSYQQTMKIPKPVHFLEPQPSDYNRFYSNNSTVLSLIPDNQTDLFEYFPFFKPVQTLLAPVCCESNIDFVSFTGLYCLTDSVIHAILKSWDTTKQVYKTRVIIRFVQIEPKENFTDRLPYNTTVTVNGQQCKLPAMNTPIKTSITPWRRNFPIDITSQTNLRSSFKNELTITWFKEPRKFMASVYVAERMTSNELLLKIKKKPISKCEKTKGLIKKFMESDVQTNIDEMYTTINDPLSKSRMQLPARGVHCIHLQCFDALQFIQINERKQTWACPLCMKRIKFRDIEIDEFFLNILQSPNLRKECEYVVLLKDGSWFENKSIQFINSSVSNNLSNKQVNVCTLSESNEEDGHTSRILLKEKKPVIECERNPAETENQTKLNNNNSSENDFVLDPSIKNCPVASTSAENPSNIKINIHSVLPKSTKTTNVLNNVCLPNITITEIKSENCEPSCSGTSSYNNTEENDK